MKFKQVCLLAGTLVAGACALPNPHDGRNDSVVPAQVLPVADDHNSANSLDWSGIYQGVLPCADCAGIRTTLTLNDNLTYTLVQQYLGSKVEDKAQGTFVWDGEGQKVILDAEGDSRQFFVGEGFVQQYYVDGTAPTGSLAAAYVMKKIK
ncbi:copper resistance protein NlpE [Snodgrassella sp. CFCC 13594]|uniref:copper resistance protein NlpE n=1 Tax=Snodgrassella sp. CFCC 13594 TaxID=1775559 RepID=UPI0008304FE1|nr:copper resistance protein NlpE [Snodgrassella sp. CFCC 13594]